MRGEVARAVDACGSLTALSTSWIKGGSSQSEPWWISIKVLPASLEIGWAEYVAVGESFPASLPGSGGHGWSWAKRVMKRIKTATLTTVKGF